VYQNTGNKKGFASYLGIGANGNAVGTAGVFSNKVEDAREHLRESEHFLPGIVENQLRRKAYDSLDNITLF
jgi:hypothetical protein